MVNVINKTRNYLEMFTLDAKRSRRASELIEYEEPTGHPFAWNKRRLG